MGLDREQRRDRGNKVPVVLPAYSLDLCVLRFYEALNGPEVNLLLPVDMDLFDDWAELFEVLRRRRLVQEMDLLKVLVDALLSVLRSARRHADFVMGSQGQGSKSVKLR